VSQTIEREQREGGDRRGVRGAYRKCSEVPVQLRALEQRCNNNTQSVIVRTDGDRG
jgi:hypothetical protein